jgi:hypothetical protein
VTTKEAGVEVAVGAGVGVEVGVGVGAGVWVRVDVGVAVGRKKGMDEHPRVRDKMAATSGTMPAGFRLMKGTPFLW